MKSPIDYRFCNQTVTVYRNQPHGVQLRVLHNAYMHLEQGTAHNGMGNVSQRKFLLIVPGPQVQVYVGDRVMLGIGPEDVHWGDFLPAAVDGLVEVGRTRHYRYQGEICHVEAQESWN